MLLELLMYLCICKACNSFICCSMIQQEVQEMTDYQAVNPYEMMYRNMNFQINEHITKETAEKIARQLGFMHNAFGVIAKDLIKILSFKFSSEPTQPRTPSSQRVYHRVDPKYRQPPPLESIEVEDLAPLQDNQYGSKKRVIETEEEKMVAVPVHQKEAIPVAVQKQDRNQEQPPNLDFLGEFAYKQSGQEQSKNSKDKSQDPLQAFRARLVEQVSNKKKKGAKSTRNTPEDDSKEKQKQLPPQPQTEKEKSIHQLSPQSQQSKPTPISHQHESKPGQKFSHPDNSSVGIFQEFQFKKEHRSPVIPIEQHQQSPKTNKIWNLLHQNRQEHQIIDISDDD